MIRRLGIDQRCLPSDVMPLARVPDSTSVGVKEFGSPNVTRCMLGRGGADCSSSSEEGDDGRKELHM